MASKINLSPHSPVAAVAVRSKVRSNAFACVCLLTPCGHLLGKGRPLGCRLRCLIVKLSLPHWCPGSGVVLDCIDS